MKKKLYNQEVPAYLVRPSTYYIITRISISIPIFFYSNESNDSVECIYAYITYYSILCIILYSCTFVVVDCYYIFIWLLCVQYVVFTYFIFYNPIVIQTQVLYYVDGQYHPTTTTTEKAPSWAFIIILYIQDIITRRIKYQKTSYARTII